MMMPTWFRELRHVETIAGEPTSNEERDNWRKFVRERMKTVSVALVLCLNIGVDPPDVIKPNPCAKLECWIDPLSTQSQKAMDKIGAALQKQYERWQPRARYKVANDPTVEEVKKLCSSMRRNAKEERVLFHYNGHGVPRPTENGEIWVFNKNFTQVNNILLTVELVIVRFCCSIYHCRYTTYKRGWDIHLFTCGIAIRRGRW